MGQGERWSARMHAVQPRSCTCRTHLPHALTGGFLYHVPGLVIISNLLYVFTSPYGKRMLPQPAHPRRYLGQRKHPERGLCPVAADESILS